MTLVKKAVAKSHRPEHLLSKKTCPIVGAGRLGELFVKATPAGLDNLVSLIGAGRSQTLVKEISCIEAIEPITPTYRRNGLDSAEVLRRSPQGSEGYLTRVRLFSFGRDADEPLFADLLKTCEERGIAIDSEGYSPSSRTYVVQCRAPDDVEALSSVVGVRSITGMPLIRTIRPMMLLPTPLPALPARESASSDVPVVVVVDSGVSDSVPGLASWIVGREQLVAGKYRNADHGTFVAGLICWGGQLNPTLAGLDTNPCAVYDLQVIPNDDPASGATEELKENEFLAALEKALLDHAHEYKVWNLSLGTDEVCSLDEFSKLAEELDNLQERYGVSFVISAGNYEDLPLLSYPRRGSQLEEGRITTPADSVLGITVGSVSHVDYRFNGPKEHEPAPYSRHGAGPNYVIKPDLVHYGGACSIDAVHQAGIQSVGEHGLVGGLGTSFAAPLVSRTLAQIYHQVTPTPSPVLARALLTHHARDPRSQQRVPSGEEDFYGFGLPSPIPYCLECTPHTSTLVFDDVLRPGLYLEWDSFPYPSSLYRDGRYFGEIWMTVAFSPARGARWGSEYCETHIEAHLGVYYDHVIRKTGEVKRDFKGLVPPEHKNPGLLYESFQVAELRKWAPVRTYYGNLGKNGKRGMRWRLKVQLLTRHGIEDDHTCESQPFSVIITIADPEGRAPVYDEMARSLRNRFQSENLAVRAAARIRGMTTE